MVISQPPPLFIQSRHCLSFWYKVQEEKYNEILQKRCVRYKDDCPQYNKNTFFDKIPSHTLNHFTLHKTVSKKTSTSHNPTATPLHCVTALIDSILYFQSNAFTIFFG